MRERIDWRTAAALWPAMLTEPAALARPAILRFAGDDFMDQLQALLADRPGRLEELLVQNETWRQPQAGPAPQTGGGGAVRLYQPAHGRFYLVAASLVCGRYGLPDKTVDAARDETVSFVLRRLDAPGNEYAWVPDGAGAGTWRPVTAVELAPGEERLPLVAMWHPEPPGRRRRLLVGLVPAAARERYQGEAPPPADVSGDPMALLADPRVAELASTVVDALEDLRQAIASPPTNPTGFAEQIRASFFFVLLDLAGFLQIHLPDLWKASGGLPGPQAILLGALRHAVLRPNTSWYAGLQAAAQSGLQLPLPPAAVEALPPVDGMTTGDVDAAVTEVLGAPTSPPSSAFLAMVADALPAADDPGEDPAEPDPGRADARYVVRCVYERPHCLDAERVRLSTRSRRFRLVPFFDPDAPARPIRIPAPVDTSIEGLRKFPKNVSVLISNQLRQQMQRVDGIKLQQLDDGEVGQELPLDLGMICQLSIPIITICALILLMIIVSLLNIVFWWLPFFKICRPLDLRAR
jgi:hypothetical protein